MTPGEVLLLALRMVVSLALVLGLLLLLARYAARRGVGRAGHGRWDIEVLARRQLSRSASVQIVRIAGQTYVLGVGDSGVRVLRRLPAAEGVGETGPQDAPGGAAQRRPPGSAGSTGPTDVAGLAGLSRTQEGAVGRALQIVQDVIRPEGRHRAARGDRGGD